MQYNDPNITLDLRQSNGNPHSTIFYAFWQEFQHYLEKTTAVDEWRHGDALHMPIAISVHHFQELIKVRLEEKFPESTPALPSQEWILLQFSSSNPFAEKVMRYTGHFNVKFGIQIRQMHKDHPDSHYVSALLKVC